MKLSATFLSYLVVLISFLVVSTEAVDNEPLCNVQGFVGAEYVYISEGISKQYISGSEFPILTTIQST